MKNLSSIHFDAVNIILPEIYNSINFLQVSVEKGQTYMIGIENNFC